MFNDDPRYQELKRIREEQGYDGPLDQDGRPDDPTSVRAQAADALRRRGAGA
ncbi:hypothetical protein [Nonomuraea sp. NPDC050643]|uniref:hypothetical protein n=1 Tax=Nonomuraea sp. NPDC050643 TaxID=3155660 RepID=UPI0033CC7DB2